MELNSGFPVTLDVKGSLCLVLGGDDEAAEKVMRLLDAGAKVTVINPTLNDQLRKLTASATIIHRVRTFRAGDTQGALLVINTLRTDREYAASLYELAKKERFLLCTTDRPDLSTCMMPALVSRGHLRLAISTSGVAPALASRLREQLTALFDEEFVEYLEWLKGLREDLQANEPDAEQRRQHLRAAVDDLRISGSVSYPPGWQDTRASAKTASQ